jgi:chaperonin GroEL (HSP60 family)|tara:strand:+ start:209 stop:592 length:384 start_codon:yes stop_codon:yes gene_type:complete
MSLYENINRRRKLGISRSKEDSTISKGSYSNMKKGFPEKAKKGKLIEEDLVDVSSFGDKAMDKYNKYKDSKETQLHSKTKKEGQQKAKDRALNEMLQEEKVKPNFNEGGEVRGGGAAIRGLGFKGVF